MCRSAFEHLDICPLLLPKCECVLALSHFQSVLPEQSQWMLKAQVELFTSENQYSQGPGQQAETTGREGSSL